MNRAGTDGPGSADRKPKDSTARQTLSVADWTQRIALPVVQQHLDDAIMLAVARFRLVGAAHVKLHTLGRIDERLSAHLDGLAIAGAGGHRLADAALDPPTHGALFVWLASALADEDPVRIERGLLIGRSSSEATQDVQAALDWTCPRLLRQPIRTMLASDDAWLRSMAIAACAAHRVDAADAISSGLEAADPLLRVTSLRAAAALGRRDLLGACLALSRTRDTAPTQESAMVIDVAAEALIAAVVLGSRGGSLDRLGHLAATPDTTQMSALSLLLGILEPVQARPILRALFDDPAHRRLLLQCIGLSGDPAYVPWLMDQMTDPALARLAAESFSMITGADLPALDLDRLSPERSAEESADDPESTDVALDEDTGLPWPDVGRIEAWWRSRSREFEHGRRYFVGSALDWPHCVGILSVGYQRQRVAAANHLCLLRPGTVRFNCAAPTRRQLGWLETMP